jgi:hypothetical protein
VRPFVENQLGFEDPEDFSKYLQTYVDHVDSCLRKNEFSDAERVLRNLVSDVLQRRTDYLRPILVSAKRATDTVAKFEDDLRNLFEDLEDSL